MASSGGAAVSTVAVSDPVSVGVSALAVSVAVVPVASAVDVEDAAGTVALLAASAPAVIPAA